MLSRRYPQFVLRGEGKTTVNSLPAYNILYTTVLEGQPMYGRAVLVLPPAGGAREGAAIVMLGAASATPRITSPSELAAKGVLAMPLKTFSFG